MTADRTGGGPDVRVSGEECSQPPDAQFWTVHVHGPDDVMPFVTEDEAECYAAAIVDLTEPGRALHPASPLSPLISAHVIPPADPVVSPVQGEAVEGAASCRPAGTGSDEHTSGTSVAMATDVRAAAGECGIPTGKVGNAAVETVSRDDLGKALRWAQYRDWCISDEEHEAVETAADDAWSALTARPRLQPIGLLRPAAVPTAREGETDEADECERADCRQIAATASDVYCDVTGGLLSYPTYDARTILAEAGEYTQRLIDEETARLREEIAAAIEAEKSSNEFRNVVLDRAAAIAREVSS